MLYKYVLCCLNTENFCLNNSIKQTLFLSRYSLTMFSISWPTEFAYQTCPQSRNQLGHHLNFSLMNLSHNLWMTTLNQDLLSFSIYKQSCMLGQATVWAFFVLFVGWLALFIIRYRPKRKTWLPIYLYSFKEM